MSNNFIEELQWRGLVQDIMPGTEEQLSKEMTVIGDLWRDFAVNASRVYKNRSNQTDVYNTLADELIVISYQEEAFFKKLQKAIKK